MFSDVRLRLFIGPNHWASETVLEVRAGTSTQAQHGLLPKPVLAKLENWLRGRALVLGPGASLQSGNWAQQLALLVSSVRLFAGLAPQAAHSHDNGLCLVLACDDQSLSHLCLEAAFALCQSAVLADRTDALDHVFADFAKHIVDLGFDPPAIALMQAARRLGLPFRRHTLLHGHYQLGEGRHQIVLDATDTNCTSAMAKAIAANKDLCNSLLTAYGFPVPRQEVVEQANDAWAAAQRVGLPAVIKPRLGSQGRGVTLDVTTRPQAVAAFEAARQIRPEVLVESTLPGEDHRVMVVGEGVIALHRLAPRVTGDGVRTIAQLIEQENQNRDVGGRVQGAIQAKDDTHRLLSAAGRTLQSVLAAGETQVLQTVPNASWSRRNVSASVHPENRRMLIEAARLIGLDVASIDFRTPDIARSWREVGGGICEVESQAALAALLRADIELIDVFVRHLAADRPTRIPHVLLIAEEDLLPFDDWASTLARDCHAAFAWRASVQTSARTSIGDQTLPCRIPAAAQVLAVEHPGVDIAIYVATAAACRVEGLGVERPTLVILADSDRACDLGDMAVRAGATVLSWSQRGEAMALLQNFDSVAVRSRAKS